MSAFSSFAKRLWRGLSDFWPHGPLALLVLAGGLANVLTGLWAEGVQALPGLRAGLPALSEHMSLGALGSSAQVVLGAGLILVGLGLLWRLRVAWSFALLLLLITIAVNVARAAYGTALILPSVVFVGLLLTQGAFTRSTARELDRRGAQLVQVLREGDDPELPERPVVRGDSSEDAVLHQAGIAAARMVVAVMDDDGENAFIALAAKDINPAARVLAVASTPRSIRRLKRAGADLVFAPAAAGTAS